MTTGTELRALEPVVVLGMHRSGTALVATMLERLGVFMGAELDPHHEAWFFLDLNRVALAQAGARWDQPEGLRAVLESTDLTRLVDAYFEYMLGSPAARRFTGSRRLGRRGGIAQAPRPWGWKDPRTVLLLPIWLRVFPRARLVHVTRHGVDVAASLRARQQKVLEESLAMLDAGRLFDWRDPERPLIESARAGTLEGGFGLWEHYMAAAADALSGREHLSLRFEDLVQSPEKVTRMLAGYLGLEAAGADFEAAASLPRSTRAFAYHQDPELRAFATGVTRRLAAFGYGVEAST